MHSLVHRRRWARRRVNDVGRVALPPSEAAAMNSASQIAVDLHRTMGEVQLFGRQGALHDQVRCRQSPTRPPPCRR